MTLLEIILLIIGAGCLVAGFFIPERPKTKASWEEKKEIKRMHDLIDSDLEKYKENLKKSLEDEMNEYMENAHKGIECLSDEKIKAVKECGETAIGNINKNHDEVKESLKTIESYKDEATADFEKSQSALDEAKDTLKAIESAKDEAKADIESAKDEAKADIEKTKSELDEAKDALKAIENAKVEAKADIDKSKDEAISEIEQNVNALKAEEIASLNSKVSENAELIEKVKAESVATDKAPDVSGKSSTAENISESNANVDCISDSVSNNNADNKNSSQIIVEEAPSIKGFYETETDLNNSVGEIEVEEVISETYSYETTDDEFTGVLSDDPEEDLIKILKEGMDESETGISDTSKENSETSEETKKTKKNKRGTKKTVKRSAESISFASKNTDEILRLYKEGKSNVAIAKELGIGVGEVKLVIDLANM